MSSKNSDKTGLRVLRIGIVQRGKIIEERELKRRETVSVGTGPKATFQVSSEDLPKSFDLFDYDGSAYHLRFTSNMDGRIQLQGNKVLDFEACRRAGTVKTRKGEDSVQLADDNRGKVVIGDVTVLFQFKTSLVAGPRPYLPAQVRGSVLENVDAQFAVIFFLVAALQISIVAYARSQPYIEPTSIEQVGEQFQRLIMPDRLPEPPRIADKQQTKPGAQEKAAKKAKAEKDQKKKQQAKKPKKKAKQNAGGPKRADASARAARKAAIKQKVAGRGLLKVLGARRGGAAGKDSLADVFQEGGGDGTLGDAFSGIQGVDIASSSGQSGTRGGGSGRGVGIGDLATKGGGKVATGVKQEAEVQGAARAETPEVDGELSQKEIARVMKRQLKALRSCYERALKRDRSLKGKLVIRFEILENGRTSSIEFENVSLGSAAVEKCIRRRAQFWRFPKPEGGSVFVAYPIVFTPAG